MPASTISFYELGRVEPTVYRMDALLKALDQSVILGKDSTLFK
nr:MAG TPA: Transcriptional regulator, Transcriptional activator, TPR, HTH [Caudoviricetes sp.]